ncbi:hypothetical protein LSAT2_028472, partial [Lamellibrachia satsuma]
FLQVDLLRTHQLSKLAIQGGGSACDCYTSTFKLLYSVDGLVWKFYESGRLQQGNSDRYRTVTLTFQSPITVLSDPAFDHLVDGFIANGGDSWTTRQEVVFDLLIVNVWNKNNALREARYFAILPTSWQYSPALRIELYGCPLDNVTIIHTNVTSDITTNRFWGFAGSPYVVRQTITVAHSATLTIQAGVEVVFIGQQTGFIVEGVYDRNSSTGLLHKGSV